MLDEDDITPPDRLRLLLLYLLYRDGLLPSDLQRLLNHANLPSQDSQIISNLELLGARTSRGLKDPRPAPLPIFPRKPPPMQGAGMEQEFLSSRHEPVVQSLLESHATNNIDANVFPYTKPPLDLPSDQAALQSTTSLRSAKPTWAKSRSTAISAENRQRVILFMAGGATYSEARACYDVGRSTGREVFCVTSHMLTPQLFVRQVSDLSADKRRLGIPAEAPKEQAPKHLFEPDEVPRPVQQPAPPQQQSQAQQRPAGPRQPGLEQGMAGMNLNGRPNGGSSSGGSSSVPPASSAQQGYAPNSSAKLTKEREKEKKKHHFFGRKG